MERRKTITLPAMPAALWAQMKVVLPPAPPPPASQPAQGQGAH